MTVKTNVRGATCALATIFLGFHSPTAQPASTEWTPERVIELSVGAGPGMPTDVTIRTIAKILKDRQLIHMPVTTANRPGAGGEIGLNALTQHHGDAHYLFIEPINILTNEITGKSRFTFHDFTPISILFSQYVVFAVNEKSPIKNGMDFARVLKKDPGALSIAIGTTLGNSNHIALGLLMKAAGGDLKRLKTVVFSGAAAAKTALLGEHVDALVSPNSNVIGDLKAGTLRVIAVASPRRLSGDFAEVPTWKEQGMDVVFSTWRSLVAPKGLSEAQIRFWDNVLGRMVQTDEWRQYLERIPTESGYMNSRETEQFFKQQHEQLREILELLGLAKK